MHGVYGKREGTVTDLTSNLDLAILKLSAKGGRLLTRCEVAKMAGMHDRVALYRAARGISGFGERSKRRKRLEKFIESAMK